MQFLHLLVCFPAAFVCLCCQMHSPSCRCHTLSGVSSLQDGFLAADTASREVPAQPLQCSTCPGRVF